MARDIFVGQHLVLYICLIPLPLLYCTPNSLFLDPVDAETVLSQELYKSLAFPKSRWPQRLLLRYNEVTPISICDRLKDNYEKYIMCEQKSSSFQL